MSCCYIETPAAPSQLSSLLDRHLPMGTFRKIFIKPNWVQHQQAADFPVSALVTSSVLLDAVIDACLRKYPEVDSIRVGDVSLQDCNWQLLCRQAGIDRLINKYAAVAPKVEFLDLRRQRYLSRNGFLEAQHSAGDPSGYRLVTLDRRSFLEEMSADHPRFRVSDYDSDETVNSHGSGRHTYLIAGSALDCDLFINVPKMKTHQKAGITGALKNLVGINGEKAYLVHFRAGSASQGGDEFPPGASPLVVAQSGLRSRLQKRHRSLFVAARWGWKLIKGVSGIQTAGTRDNLSRHFYVAGGAWFGNETIWRMIFDLNKIVLYAPRVGGPLAGQPQRRYFAVLDAITAGEGNGPLQPLPVEIGAVLLADDPFLMDMAMAQLMGLDFQKIPCLREHRRFGDSVWGNFDPGTVPLWIAGERYNGIASLPVLHRFEPAPGWKGHIESEVRVAS